MFHFYRYGADCTQVDLGKSSFFFSYKTPVAFRLENDPTIVVCENVWGSTTGAHIAGFTTDRPSDTVPREKFKTLLKQAYTKAIISAAQQVGLKFLRLEESHDHRPASHARKTEHLPDGTVA